MLKRKTCVLYICLVETQDMCCVESYDMCVVQSQYEGGGRLRPSATPYCFFRVDSEQSHVRALQTAHIWRLDKANIFALNKAYLPRLYLCQAEQEKVKRLPHLSRAHPPREKQNPKPQPQQSVWEPTSKRGTAGNRPQARQEKEVSEVSALAEAHQ